MLTKKTNKGIGRFLFPKFRYSLYVLWKHARIRRLFKEDAYVEGVGWYARNCEDFWHIPLNILRVLIILIFAPVYAILRVTSMGGAAALSGIPDDEPVCTPDAMLYKSPSIGGEGKFDPTGRRPRWLLKVTFRGAAKLKKEQVEQIAFGDEEVEIKAKGYTAISYPMDSAEQLFKEAGKKPKDPQPSPDRKWSLRDRKRISWRVLVEYGRARYLEGFPASVEYVWLDEFCLSPEEVTDQEEVEKERRKELGILADIFRGAGQVLVFCSRDSCDHTSTKCPWGQRLFTIGEILHAEKVVTLIRRPREGDSSSKLGAVNARDFKSDMQRAASEDGYFHLSTILQHVTNAGSSTWQSVIHALVVEAIRRDEAGGFKEHRYLGKALNGLLPRRAHMEDLDGKSGWADLAWLLELNQGYYNAAGLAAVCGVNLSQECAAGYRWWGNPILPTAGNERLEPVATAFPVLLEESPVRDDDERTGKKELIPKPIQDFEEKPALTILAPQIIHIHHRICRDRDGLYRHESMVSLRNVVCSIATLMTSVGIPLLSLRQVSLTKSGAVLLYLAFVIVAFVELLASTVYIVREGWVFLPDGKWKKDPSVMLGERDPRFKKLRLWGERQMIPHWCLHEAEEKKSGRLIPGSLIDMKSRVYTKVFVIEGAYPDLMAMLAVHGTGITGILLKKPYNDDEGQDDNGPGVDTHAIGKGAGVKLFNNFTGAGLGIGGGSLSGNHLGTAYAERDNEELEPIGVYTKVGMANVPAYVLPKSEHSGTIFVGGELPAVPKDVPGDKTGGGGENRAQKIWRTARRRFGRRPATAGTPQPAVIGGEREHHHSLNVDMRHYPDLERGRVLELTDSADPLISLGPPHRR